MSVLLGLVGLWSRLGAWLSAALAGVTGFVTRNPWQALVIAFAAVCGLLVWRNDRLAEDAKQARADQAQAESALNVEQASNALLNAKIDQQTAAVTQLGTDSAKAVAQGNRADADAVARSAGRAAQRARIIVPTGPVQADCRTPDSVMAAKGDL